MDTIKQVRVRKIVEGANTGALDLRVMLLQGTASTSQRIARGQVSISSQLYWSEVIYEGARYQDKTNDEILQEYIASNSEIEANRIGSKLGNSLFKIVQNPWNDEVPQLRKYGEDPYFLNNGAYINISWRKNLEISYVFEPYYVYGNGTASDPTKILVDAALFLDGYSPSDIDVDLPNFFELNYKTTTGTGSIDEFYGFTLSQSYTIDSALSHAQNAALNDGFEQMTGDYIITVSGNLLDLTLPKTGPSSFTRNISGYEYSDETLKEVNTPNYIFKSFYVVPSPLTQPSIDGENEEFDRFWSFDDKYTPRYILEFAGGITNSVIPVSLTYSYDVKDEFIVSNIIENWVKSLSTAYPSAKNYSLRLSNPSYTFPTTDLINDYSPKRTFVDSGKVFKWETVGDNPNVFTPNPATGGSGSVIPPAATQSQVELIKLNPLFPENWIVKTDEPAPKFNIWVGDIEADVPVEGFLYSDTTDDLSGLAPEFLEEDFLGADEEFIAQINSIDDEPTGPSEDESQGVFIGNTTTEVVNPVAGEVDKSPVGNGPILGSKLTNKAGTSMTNLAGHRLELILKDLQSYLNKNGYSGAKIGNNGVMRNLKESAYPNSPLRASASLHGAGLAIDVLFTIPGFKWKSIYDNENLAKDPKLTKVINNFVKGQGDITWGASWGDNGGKKPNKLTSKPAEGIVYGRGISEYHHFEIKADQIPKYWEPLKTELAKFGFKPADLKSPGKGSNLHKLMLKLLGG
jgi:hypothetical protein